jgi:RNase P subunit RPR2
VLCEIFTVTDVSLEFSFKFQFGGNRVVCTCNYCSWINTYNLLQGTKIGQTVFYELHWECRASEQAGVLIYIL